MSKDPYLQMICFYHFKTARKLLELMNTFYKMEGHKVKYGSPRSSYISITHMLRKRPRKYSFTNEKKKKLGMNLTKEVKDF